MTSRTAPPLVGPDRITSRPPRPGTGPRGGRRPGGAASAWIDLAVAAVTAFVAAVIATTLFTAYHADPDPLWANPLHDRNGHFGFGLDLAIALRGLDPLAVLDHLWKALGWSPLHGLMLSGVLLAGGLDHRLGILPSLAGWAATAVLAAVLARSLFSDAIRGITAAAVAAALTLASPAFALLGSDVVPEGLGAALTAAALLAYARAEEEPADTGRWRLLGVVLTLLFFHQRAAWGLVVATLALCTVIAHAGAVRRFAGALADSLRSAARTGPLWRDPLLIVLLVVVAATAAILWTRPPAITIHGRSVSLYPPVALVTLAYALLLLRLVLGWRSERDRLGPALGAPAHAVLAWHVMPVALSFLVPGWLTGTGGLGGLAAIWGARPDPLQGLAFYRDAFIEAYHSSPWMGLAAAALFVVALVRIHRIPVGLRPVFVLALLGAIGVVAYPLHEGRFLATVVVAVWIGAGAGVATLVGAVTPARLVLVRAVVALGAVAALLVALAYPGPTTAAAARAAAGRTPDGPSQLLLVRPALPLLDGAPAVGVATTFGRATDFLAWAARARCGCAVPVDGPRPPVGGSGEAHRRAMAAYLAETPSARVVVVDVPDAPWTAPGTAYADTAGVLDALAQQSRFVPIGRTEVPDFAGSVAVWERRDTPARPAPGTPRPAGRSPVSTVPSVGAPPASGGAPPAPVRQNPVRNPVQTLPD
ncbi:hypothetical protein [Rhodoplanes azumiensis]|uniref:Glycosyltransferase RgtA/B/C/D-like domain-containing protein n=1 Tax=Rhodoplanes azumiensis TaxID=1897628 RepID=A0ABW5AMD4_9BRAD